MITKELSHGVGEGVMGDGYMDIGGDSSNGEFTGDVKPPAYINDGYMD